MAAVIAAGRWAADRGWVPATSGNFSARVDAGTIAITRSGPDKGHLGPEDVLFVELAAPDPRASAEAALHYALYRRERDVNAVVHVHAPWAALMGRLHLEAGEIMLEGWELQKAFAGVTSHESRIKVPVFANSQDLAALAATVEARYHRAGDALTPAYLLAGHGLYAWGRDASEARRHAEALENLLHLQCQYERLRR